MSTRLKESLAQQWQKSTRRQSALIFTTGDFKKAFNNACSDAGFADVHFHDLRHTAITRMLEKGISPPLVMKISGHTQQKTFLRYVNQSESSLYDIALKLDQAAETRAPSPAPKKRETRGIQSNPNGSLRIAK